MAPTLRVPLGPGNAVAKSARGTAVVSTSHFPKFPLPRSQDLFHPLFPDPRPAEGTANQEGLALVVLRFGALCSGRVMPLVKTQGHICLPHFAFSCDGKVRTSATAGVPLWVPDYSRFTKNARLPRAVHSDGDMAVTATHSHTDSGPDHAPESSYS